MNAPPLVWRRNRLSVNAVALRRQSFIHKTFHTCGKRGERATAFAQHHGADVIPSEIRAFTGFQGEQKIKTKGSLVDALF
ncbi:MAG TPA: hypothetical protein DCW86_02490 [Actinobacteria bacterium]|nr:hypothetical protein [Actinomycetota bacterium]